jgi:outer membrane protein
MPVPTAVPGVPQNITLQQAIDIAAARSPVLAQARANNQLAQLNVPLAVTGYLPNLSATASSSRSNNGASAAAGRFGGSFTSRGLNANLRQLIYDGGKVIAQIRQARAGAVAGAETYQRSLETLSFNVAQAYYTALAADAAVRVDQQLLSLNQANQNLVNAQVRTGVAPRIDAVTAAVPTAQAEATLLSAQGTEAAALGAFANQLGLDANTLVRPVNNTPSNPSVALIHVLPYDQSVARALAQRPDYLAAQETAVSARYAVQVQRAGYYPTISGTASYGTNSTTVNGQDFAPNSSFGFTVSIPLYDQGVTRVQVQQALAQLDLANAQVAQAKLGVQLNVQQSLSTLLSDQAAVSQNVVAVTSARESLRATQAQYRAGVSNLFTLLQAQTNLTTASTSELDAIYALRQAEQSYIYALGESSINPTPP